MTATRPGPSDSLDVWLHWLERIHPQSIDMGLERIAIVADRLSLRPLSVPLILVAGTNGKGSTVAMLSAIYERAGYRTGQYTSPHIEHFCERVRVDGQMVSEPDMVQALMTIEEARADISLTYFEYTTLAAMWVFARQHCDVLVVEVGLGGRLDATNIWDADCAIVTSIGLDHEEYLGSDIRQIAIEKAAIGRRHKPMIVGDRNPPVELFSFCQKQGMQVRHVGAMDVDSLPHTSLAGMHQRFNAACACAAVEALQTRLPVEPVDRVSALMQVRIAGRFERLEFDGIPLVLDVAHNPAGAQALCSAWQLEMPDQRCQVVFAAMSDKDIKAIVEALSPIVSTWHCPSLNLPRAQSGDETVSVISSVAAHTGQAMQAFAYTGVEDAWLKALEKARHHQHAVLVAGSFHTLAAVQHAIGCAGSGVGV